MDNKNTFCIYAAHRAENPQFFKIQPGLWALEEYRHQLPFVVEEKNAPRAEQEQFNHSYFQGLLVEIGNFHNLATYVPLQVKNKAFLSKYLDEVTTVKKIFPFCYDDLLRSARTVDVVWFNDRQMPSAFLEVEHSTDIYNSLRKFVNLQDFYVDFTVVAPKARKPEFDAKRSETPYRAIEKRVNFWDYEGVAKAHGHLAGLVAWGGWADKQ